MESQHHEKYIPVEVRSALYYVVISIQFVAVTVSIVVVMGLVIPLLIQLKNGNFYQTTRRTQRIGQEPPYSTYNLYLVYLGIVDLLYLIPMIAAEWRAANEEYLFHPQFYANLFPDHYGGEDFGLLDITSIMVVPYCVANYCINAVIVYEVLILLRASKYARRITQPSLKRVNLQGGSSILSSVLCGGVLYYVKCYYYSNKIKAELSYHSVVFPVIALGCVPMLYAFIAIIIATCRGYLPTAGGGSTPRDRAVRGLTIYFFRVGIVFVAVWLPVWVIANLAYNKLWDSRVPDRFVAATLMAIQPILTFCMILGKPDVKKYITDFVTLSYVFGDKCSIYYRKNNTIALFGGDEIANETQPDTEPETEFENPSQIKSVTTILGYTFSDVDGDEDSDSDAEKDIDRTNNITLEDSEDAEMGCRIYESRRNRRGSTAVLPTGEAVFLHHDND